MGIFHCGRSGMGGIVEEQSVVGFEVMALNTNNILRSSKKFINSPNSVLARNV